MTLTWEERILYHQIHPAKLVTDIASALAALLLLSSHALAAGLAVALLPPVAVSVWLVRRGELTSQKRSDFGKYVRKWMTPGAQGRRLAGFGAMAYAAWTHSYPLMAFGVALVVHAWTAGLLLRRK